MAQDKGKGSEGTVTLKERRKMFEQQQQEQNAAALPKEQRVVGKLAERFVATAAKEETAEAKARREEMVKMAAARKANQEAREQEKAEVQALPLVAPSRAPEGRVVPNGEEKEVGVSEDRAKKEKVQRSPNMERLAQMVLKSQLGEVAVEGKGKGADRPKGKSNKVLEMQEKLAQQRAGAAPAPAPAPGAEEQQEEELSDLQKFGLKNERARKIYWFRQATHDFGEYAVSSRQRLDFFKPLDTYINGPYVPFFKGTSKATAKAVLQDLERRETYEDLLQGISEAEATADTASPGYQTALSALANNVRGFMTDSLHRLFEQQQAQQADDSSLNAARSF